MLFYVHDFNFVIVVCVCVFLSAISPARLFWDPVMVANDATMESAGVVPAPASQSSQTPGSSSAFAVAASPSMLLATVVLAVALALMGF
jgi:hypothetical protein